MGAISISGNPAQRPAERRRRLAGAAADNLTLDGSAGRCIAPSAEQAREAFPLVFLLRLKHAKASLSHTEEARVLLC